MRWRTVGVLPGWAMGIVGNALIVFYELVQGHLHILRGADIANFDLWGRVVEEIELIGGWTTGVEGLSNDTTHPALHLRQSPPC